MGTTIGFYISHKKNDECHIWVIYDDSILPERNLKPMSLNCQDKFCSRKATDKELRQIAEETRFISYPYNSIEKLIYDERKLGVPEETIQKIISMYKGHYNHKKFSFNKGGEI